MLVTACNFGGIFSGNAKFPLVLLLVFIVFMTKTAKVTSFVSTISTNDKKLVGEAFGNQPGTTASDVRNLHQNRVLYTVHSCQDNEKECRGNGDDEMPLLFVYSDGKGCCGKCTKEEFTYKCKGCIAENLPCPKRYGCCSGLYCNQGEPTNIEDNLNAPIRDPKCDKCITEDKDCNQLNDGCCVNYYCHIDARTSIGKCKKCIKADQRCSSAYSTVFNDCCEGYRCNSEKNTCTKCVPVGEKCPSEGDFYCDKSPCAPPKEE